jgi:integrase
MAKHNAANERIKREYFQYLREAKRCSETSVDAAAKALSRFEDSNGWREFKTFHREKAVAFKRKLADQLNARTGERLSKATMNSTLRALRAFFIWLAGQSGYKSKIQYSDADYFNLPEKDVAVARATRHKVVPTLDQMHYVLSVMPTAAPLEQRNRALVAFAMLTGARDGALSSFRLKHVDIAQGLVQQDGRDVRTKFSKTFTTWFLPVGGDALTIVQNWVIELRSVHLWGPDDPLFPATETGVGPDGGFVAIGLARRGWSSTQTIRKIFRDAFTLAGLPYSNPHSLRDMLAQHGERLCQTPEQFKAWSQNLGHADVMTTLTSYGEVPSHRQAELIRGIGRSQRDVGRDPLDDANVPQLLAALAKKHGIGQPSLTHNRPNWPSDG